MKFIPLLVVTAILCYLAYLSLTFDNKDENI